MSKNPDFQKVVLSFSLAFLVIEFNCIAQSVDPSSGRFQMSVSLGGLQANDISIPIALNHHGNALRVYEGEGAGGLGWGLTATGSITRVVQGLPDELSSGKRGWSYNNYAQAQSIQSFSPAGSDTYSTCPDTNELADYDQIKTLAGDEYNPVYDTEPDMYYINAPGLYAQFVLGTDGQPKLLSHQDINIQYNGTGAMTVTTNRGLVYTFGTTESVIRTGTLASDNYAINASCRYFKDGITFIARWHLTSIVSAATGTTATFSYQQLGEVWSNEFMNEDSLNQIRDKFSPYRISSITLKSFSAYFTWSNNHLAKVELNESNTLDKKEFTFEYTSTTSFGTGTQIFKPFLTRINQVNNCSPVAAYEFEYNLKYSKVSPNWRTMANQDLFGFYNGATGNTNHPTLYYYANEADGRRLRTSTIPGLTATSTYTGDNRSVTPDSAAFGAIKFIRYPTGGYTQVEYESNRYWDASSSQELLGGGVRVKKITSQGGEIAFGKSIDQVSSYRAITKEYEYKLANNNSSGVIMSPPKFGYIYSGGVRKLTSNMGDEPDILYTRVKEKVSGQGYKILEFSAPGVFPETTNGSWKATKSRIARQSGTCNYGNIKNGYYTFPFPPSSNTTRRGILRKVSEYSEADVLIRQQIDSTIELSSNATTIKGLRFERIGEIFHYGIYEIQTGRIQVPYQKIVKESSEETPSQWLQTTTTYSYNSNNMLQSVTTVLPDGTSSVKTISYAKDFQYTSPVSTDTMAVALKKLNDQRRYGEVVEEISKVTLPGQSQKTVGGRLTLYREFSTNRVSPYYVWKFRLK